MQAEKELDIILPVELTEQNLKETIDAIIFQNQNYGFKKFALITPSKGFRRKGFPDNECYERSANAFNQVKNAVNNKEISIGWWNNLTIKSGRNIDFSPVVKEDGSEHPFANCPLGENFQHALAERVALFAKIAQPDFITFEDDYSVSAAAGAYGCFCPLHLAEFNKREGKEYTREQLLEIFLRGDSESLELLRRYRALSLDSMVVLSNAVRKELDKVKPNTPIILLESGSTDFDGGSTVKVAKALAGTNAAASRLHGTFYLGGETKSIPAVLYHAVFIKEHAPEDFLAYHETDTYPHTRFYSSAKQMKAIMATVYSSGFCGSLFHTVQCTVQEVDNVLEEKAYSQMVSSEIKRFNEAYRKASLSERVGAHVPYDTFYNSFEWTIKTPLWIRAVSLFGIPFTTKQREICFLDDYQLKYIPDQEILGYLSKTVFLDGDAAAALCKRGYGKYLGVSVGEDVTLNTTLPYDLAAYEKIVPPFESDGGGKIMPIAHTYANGHNGKLLKLTKTSDKCLTVSQAFTFEHEFISTAMTYFENDLGGKVIVMGMTLKNNISQSLFNYRRQRLFNDLLIKCGCDFPLVKDSPNVHLIANKAKDEKAAGFKYMVTLINLGDDTIKDLKLYLPKSMQSLTPYRLEIDGTWEKANVTADGEHALINDQLDYCEPLYLLFK